SSGPSGAPRNCIPASEGLCSRVATSCQNRQKMHIQTGRKPKMLPRPPSLRTVKPKHRGIGADARGTALLPWIRGLLPTLKSAPRRIANALLEDPERFLTDSVSELATHCGVSGASIVLFCKSLGLTGLPMLRISLARE